MMQVNFDAIRAIISREELIAFLAEGYRADYLFFWGHTVKDPSRVGQECLSQWYGAGFEINGVFYPTAEHYMMSEKARLFDDDVALEKILASRPPGDAKILGRTVKNYQDTIWKQHRFDIVIRGNHAKFSQNPELKTFLLNTHNKILVEASPRDRIWGIGMGKTNPDALNPSKWRGMNLLGFALMSVRNTL